QRIYVGTQLHRLGGTVFALRHQVIVIQGTHRIDRCLGETKTLDQVFTGTRYVEQLQQAERTVFIKEVVVEIDVLQFPQVVNQPRHLFIVQRQAVLPDITVLQVRVFLDLGDVGNNGEAARVATGETTIDIQQRVVLATGERTKVHRPGMPDTFRLSGIIKPQQGVAKHRRRAVQVGGRKHQHGTAIGNLLTPLKIVGTVRQRFGFLPAELACEETVARRKATAILGTGRL